MSPELQALFTQHVAQGFAKQLAFADLLGERNWNVNITEGHVAFGDDLSFPIQLLGTEAEGNATWLWAWANEASNLPDDLLHAANALQSLGQDRNIPELVERSFSLDEADGHTLSLIASGLNPDCAYYRGPYEGGALFFLVQGVPTTVTGPVDGPRAITVLGEVISQFEVDHRQMAESFLASNNFEVRPLGNALQANQGGSAIVITFDEQNRITNIEGQLSPQRSSDKKWWQFWKS